MRKYDYENDSKAFESATIDFFYDDYFKGAEGHDYTDEETTMSVNKADVDNCIAIVKDTLYRHFDIKEDKKSLTIYTVIFICDNDARTSLFATEREAIKYIEDYTGQGQADWTSDNGTTFEDYNNYEATMWYEKSTLGGGENA